MRKPINTSKTILWVLLCLFAVMLTGCISAASAEYGGLQAGAISPTAIEETRILPETGSYPTAVEKTATKPASTPAPRITKTTAPKSTTPASRTLKASPTVQTPGPARWKEWPVIPVISAQMRQIYQQGLAAGNNPHAFSVLGDCQSQPDVFMGVFDNDLGLVKQLPIHLQQTVRNFSGSFDRYSPAVKDGTTEGALLFALWNDNKEKKCEYGETPLECELRVHNPSIVFIHVGTHWEARNRIYLNKIIDRILEHQAVPVLVTKADNLELDERINQSYAEIAYERGLPLWNFWASVQHLPQGGMKDEMYLSDEALIVHRNGALEALDAVWRAVK